MKIEVARNDIRKMTIYVNRCDKFLYYYKVRWIKYDIFLFQTVRLDMITFQVILNFFSLQEEIKLPPEKKRLIK